TLTVEQVPFFEEHGYLLVGKILTDEELETLRERADWIASAEDVPHIPPQYRQTEPRVARGVLDSDNAMLSLRKIWHLAWYDEVMAAHARNPQITERIAALIGPDLKLYQDQLFMKPPRVGSRQPYHQDQPLGFHIDPPHLMVTCWTALDDATLENGCLRVIPGTHRKGVLPATAIDEYEQQALNHSLVREVPLPLKAGECSFHHGHLLHSSYPNLSQQRRRGYATHYVSARCRYAGEAAGVDFPPEGFLSVRGRAFPRCL
ncbi:MAG TPA: phytanoyl-CoA dioxygenase family protein, partial [Abditibacteriaceae bacterium]|nr:phytanoyl-CoA dioxygenase family protein [Abditibacteriaceae bacterium]